MWRSSLEGGRSRGWPPEAWSQRKCRHVRVRTPRPAPNHLPTNDRHEGFRREQSCDVFDELDRTASPRVQVGHLLGAARNPVHKTCLAVMYAAVCASARQPRWRSVPLTERTRCCGSSERATSNDWRRCHSRCSMTWAACHQGSRQVGAQQVQGTAAEEAP